MTSHGMYQDRLESGVCVRCGKRPRSDHRMCPVCRTQSRQQAARYGARRSAGERFEREEYIPEHWCKTCYGLPHRRRNPRCLECGGQYSPLSVEIETERTALYTSRVGSLWGE